MLEAALRHDGLDVHPVASGRREGEVEDKVEDKVRGLTGGDDYPVKPFRLEELVARINAVLRRTGAAKDDDAVLRCADLEMADDAHRVTRASSTRSTPD